MPPPDDLDRTMADPDRPFLPSGAALSEGNRIGNYRALRQIGEGGMGEVWEAEQQEPVQRRVAIKLIRAGMDSRQFVARFEAERQALAVMDHPGIAKIFDAGSTERGIPYFVMELVPGVPLIEYCDEHALGTEQRLALFMKICDGVTHAHQKGIIHRDLKPGNILVSTVDGEPVPKIIDFGVAKATDEKVTDRTMLTRAGALIGTLEYMSPEQLAGSDDIDTRVDVYALGVILYETLTGRLPFDTEMLSTNTLLEICRILREEDPGRPSTHLETLGDDAPTIARTRGTDVRSLKRRLHGDLDWITMKALEKDRTLRYASASELALDIRRHLNDDPVLAGPPSVRYRLGKLRRRHRAAFAGGLAVIVALLAGVAGTTWQAVRATQAEARATEEAAEATAVNRFLADMLAEANPERNQDREVTLREVLDDAASRVEDGFGDQPAVRAAVQNTIGNTYLGLGRYEEAEQQLRAALEIREGAPEANAADIAESRRSLGKLFWSRSDFETAEPLVRDALFTYRELYGDADDRVVSCLIDLAVVRQTLGDYEEAEGMLREALESSRTLDGEESARVAEILSNLAWVRRFRGDVEESEQLSKRALELNRKNLGADHPNVLIMALNLAAMIQERGGYEDAEELYRDTLARMRAVLGPDHPVTLQGQMSLGEMYLRQERTEAGEPLLRETLAAAEETLGPDHQVTIRLIADVGWALRTRGDLAGAEEPYREALARRIRSLGDEHPLTIRARWQVSRLLVDQAKFEDGERLAREALETGRRVLPEENENLSSTLLYLGLALVGRGEHVAAEPYLRECVDKLQVALSKDRWEILQARSALIGAALAGQQRFEEAELQLTASARALLDDADAPPIRVRKALERVVELYRRWDETGVSAGKAPLRRQWAAELRRHEAGEPG